MGIVVAATDRTDRTRVAIKSMLVAADPSSEAARRFRREAIAASRVVHPAVVRTLDSDVDADGHPFLVMELLAGESLADFVERRGPPSLPQVIAVLRRILGGIAAAHDAGVIHRDLKPDNIRIAHPRERAVDERVKIVDFGISRLSEVEHGRVTRTGGLLGTPWYMALEQATGDEVDARTDLYGVGVIAYEMISGARPYADVPDRRVMATLLKGPPTSLREMAPSAPGPLVAWIERLMSRAKEDRFASARTALDALDATAASLGLGEVSGEDPIGEAMLLPEPNVSVSAFEATLPVSGDAVVPAPRQAERVAPATPRSDAEPVTESQTAKPMSALHAMTVGLLLTIVPVAIFGRSSFRGSVFTASEGADASTAVAGAMSGLAWLFLGIAALVIGAKKNRSLLAIVSFSQLVYRVFICIRAISPSLAQVAVLSSCGHASSVISMTFAGVLGARLFGIAPKVLTWIDRAAFAVLAIFVPLSMTRLWDGAVGSKLVAGPALICAVPSAALVATALGIYALQSASRIEDIDARQRRRGAGLAYFGFSLTIVGDSLPYFHAPTQVLSLVSLPVVGLLAYGALGMDEMLALRVHGLRDALRLTQGLALGVTALYTSAFMVLLAKDWTGDIPIRLLLLPGLSASFALLLAWRTLSVEEPSGATVLLGLVLACFGSYELSILHAVFGSDLHVLWFSRASNIAYAAMFAASIPLARITCKRTSDRWMDVAALSGFVVIAPLMLTDAYIVGVRHFSFGSFAQAGWALTAWFLYAATLGAALASLLANETLRARGDARRSTGTLALGLAFLGYTPVGNMLVTFGVSWSYPLTNFGFIAVALVSYAVLRSELPALSSFVRRSLLRTVGSIVLALLVTLLFLKVSRLTASSHPLVGAVSSALILVVAIEPLRVGGQRLVNWVLKVEEIDERAGFAALIRGVDTGLPTSDGLDRASALGLRSALGVPQATLLVRAGNDSFASRDHRLSSDHPVVPALRRALLPIRTPSDVLPDVPPGLEALGDALILVPVSDQDVLIAVLAIAVEPGTPLVSRRAREFLVTFSQMLGLLLARTTPTDRISLHAREPSRPTSGRKSVSASEGW
jgi:serine/threonine protein kinase